MDMIKEQKAVAKLRLGAEGVNLKALSASVAKHIFNYNTVESTLLGSAVFVCLSGTRATHL